MIGGLTRLLCTTLPTSPGKIAFFVWAAPPGNHDSILGSYRYPCGVLSIQMSTHLTVTEVTSSYWLAVSGPSETLVNRGKFSS
jgi:hypothetical protein